MKVYFDKQIKPALDKLDDLLKVNDLTHYTKDGITHIYVFDEDFSHDGYELVDGEWVERSPF